MAQNASTPELAPVFQNASGSTLVAGSLDATRLADMTRKVRRFVARHSANDDALSTTWADGRNSLDDARLLGTESRLFVAGTSDLEQREVVHVSPAGVSDDGEEVVRVTFPERAALDAQGDDAAHSYETTALDLLRRMDADGGWTEVRAFETVGTVNCPSCGAFLRIGEDGHGFPAAECSRVSCNGFLDDRELVERNAVENVY